MQERQTIDINRINIAQMDSICGYINHRDKMIKAIKLIKQMERKIDQLRYDRCNEKGADPKEIGETQAKLWKAEDEAGHHYYQMQKLYEEIHKNKITLNDITVEYLQQHKLPGCFFTAIPR